jgi:putative FmdB family regulatory protein
VPTYNYKCSSCEIEFSTFQGINDESVKRCIECDSKKIERLITGGTGMIFKGDGFYLTDYTDYGKKDKKNIDKNNKGKNNDSKSKNSK